MSEGEKQKSDIDRETAFFSAVLAGWFATSLEADKSKLVLSAAGIGLLVTLMTTMDRFTFFQFVLYMIAIGFFVITLACILLIFTRNAHHLKKVIDEGATTDSLLKFLDNLSSACFFIAILFSMAIGFMNGLQSLNTIEETLMSNDQEKQTNSEILEKSFEGIAELKPKDDSGNVTNSTNETPSKPGPADSEDPPK